MLSQVLKLGGNPFSMTLSSISMRLARPGTALMVNWRSCLLKRPFSAYESHISYGGRQITLKILQKMVDFQLTIKAIEPGAESVLDRFSVIENGYL